MQRVRVVAATGAGAAEEYVDQPLVSLAAHFPNFPSHGAPSPLPHQGA